MILKMSFRIDLDPALHAFTLAVLATQKEVLCPISE
jgi:hypothetical protein